MALMRSLAAGLAAVVLTLGFVSACGVSPRQCSAKNCAVGCCDEDGECLKGTGLLECGAGGAKCARCAPDETCRSGACELLGDGGVYDGGLIGVGGGMGGVGAG